MRPSSRLFLTLEKLSFPSVPEVPHCASLVRWQQQAEWRRTGINFAETSGQGHPDENMLRKEKKNIHNLSFTVYPLYCYILLVYFIFFKCFLTELHNIAIAILAYDR